MPALCYDFGLTPMDIDRMTLREISEFRKFRDQQLAARGTSVVIPE